MKKIILLLTFFTASFAFGQDYGAIIDSYLTNNRSQFGLQEQDIQDVKINSQHFSKSMQSEMVYASQRYQGIEIFNSVSSFAIKNGSVINAAMSFNTNINSRVNATSPSITPAMAVTNAAGALGIQNPSNLVLLETISNQSFVFSNGNISLENIPVKLVLQPTEGNSIRLAWDLSIYLLDASHWFSVRIDALTGTLLSTHDWVVSCNLGTEPHSGHHVKESILFSKGNNTTMETTLGSSSYRVFPLPLENPNEGPSQLVSNPEDLIASPFGWHDTNGVAGADFTITRGNNVWAMEDVNGNNGIGASPDGGATLEFDFPYNLPQAPTNFLQAATVNLFYWNNILHDVMYRYGFDEASGNFQVNNYGNGGAGNDEVFADAQDGGGLNNANFATPPDGNRPRMQMYLWSAPINVLGTLMTVNSGPLAGQYLAIDSNYGGTPLPVAPITANMVVMEDDDAGPSSDPNDGCDNITNAGALNGKIAVVRRGECNFTVKVISAEAAGAVAVVVVNNVPTDPIAMGGTGAGIGIPAIMIYQEDGEAIITSLLNGDVINATLQDDGSGDDPFQRDGDLDNGIIAHEYGHGISNRLTGNSVGCLQNDEQMGEGWSDYFGLILTQKADDEGEDVRSTGSYVLGQGDAGLGLRSQAYSTDPTVNDFTYADTNTLPQPHGIGSVWAMMLWDLTWKLIDQYGYDPDIYNGTGGNNIALQLVIDGLKLQPCSPGFVNARDAILAADVASNGGDNRCLIWNVFAARGLGFSASQGSAFNRFDQVEAFDNPADCQLGTGNIENLNNFIIYPNPSNGDINIMTRVEVGNADISIFDMNGRKVFAQEVELRNSVNINASGLKTGIYLIQIDGANHSHTAKLIIQ